ncbi:MAG TPA: DUF3826 domain-containing protein [Puia sp.]|jgi:hypothetical protein|nr:DUF3826 domain-containing protein [Puia sp.]
MKECLFALGTTLFITLSVATSHAAPGHTVANSYEDTAYLRVIKERATKIVNGLGLKDSATALRVRDVVARQYYDLNAIYTERDAHQLTGEEVDKKVAELHGQYLARLAKDLDPQQVDGVKDGMTYNVLHVTYRAYEEMLPDLTEEQKARILSDLTEAREHAMDAESSKKKHAWFGKYKGRINNYLSAAGIDMKKAEQDWAKRRANGK